MSIKPESTARNFTRSIAMGVLLSMLFFYSIHVLGTWQIENYRPNSQTTFTTLLHNTCLVFNHKHTLRPNTGITAIKNGINETKLSGSFMNFFDGHIPTIIILSLLLGGVIFTLRNSIQKKRQSKSVR